MIPGCRVSREKPSRAAERPAASSIAADASPAPSAEGGDAAAGDPAASARPALPDERTLTLGGGDEGAAVPRTGAGSSSGVWPFFQMVIILGLTALAVYGIAMLLLRARKKPGVSRPGVAVLATTALAPGKSVHVIKAGTKGYLIGAADHAVSLIAEVQDKEYLDALELEAQKTPKGGTGLFEAFLRGLAGNRALRGVRKGSADQLDFISRQKDRLKGL